MVLIALAAPALVVDDVEVVIAVAEVAVGDAAHQVDCIVHAEVMQNIGKSRNCPAYAVYGAEDMYMKMNVVNPKIYEFLGIAEG